MAEPDGPVSEPQFFFELGRLFQQMRDTMIDIKAFVAVPDPLIMEALARIEANQEDLMSALTDAVEKIVAAYNTNQGLLAQALAADAADRATIDSLTAQAAATNVDVNTAISEINAALPAEPDVAPADAPPADVPPADVPPADQPPA